MAALGNDGGHYIDYYHEYASGGRVVGDCIVNWPRIDSLFSYSGITPYDVLREWDWDCVEFGGNLPELLFQFTLWTCDRFSIIEFVYVDVLVYDTIDFF